MVVEGKQSSFDRLQGGNNDFEMPEHCQPAPSHEVIEL